MDLPEFDALPPPSVPLVAEEQLPKPYFPSLDIPLRSWERHTAKKLFQLNRIRANAITSVPSTKRRIELTKSAMSSGTALRDNVFSLLQTLQIPQNCPWPLRSSEQISLQRLGGAMTNLMFIVSIHSEPMKDIPSKSTSLSRGSTADSSISLSKENTISNGISSNSVNSACSASSVHSDQFKTIKVLLRIYGHGTEQFFSRERELYIIQVFSSMNIGPKLLGMFGNGRFEEYMDSDTLTSHDVRLPGISREIARKLYDIHSLVGIVKMDGVEEEMSANGESWSMGRYHSVPKYPSELWDRIYDWYEKALDAISQLLQQDACSHAERLRELRLETFIGEIRQLEKKLNALDSPVVFAHNDTQYGNVLRTRPFGDILIIDYEYACYNQRGFDIANHFCEWAADYHSDTPHILNFSKLPNENDQMMFFEAYLDARDQYITNNPYAPRRPSVSMTTPQSTPPMQPSERPCSPVPSESAVYQTISKPLSLAAQLNKPGNLGPSPRLSPTLSPMLTPQHLKMLRIQEIQRLKNEVDHFMLASHLMWGLWGIVQAGQSVIEFDYIGYALQRFDEYARWKRDVLRWE